MCVKYQQGQTEKNFPLVCSIHFFELFEGWGGGYTINVFEFPLAKY